MNIALVLTALGLSLACLRAQQSPPDAEEGKTVDRMIRVIIAGQRALPEFEQVGDRFVEREPSTRWLIPTALEIIGSHNNAAETAGKPQRTAKALWPNEVIDLGRHKCASALRVRLTRTPSKQLDSPAEIRCELADMVEPLIVISAENGGKGWDAPQVRVIDFSSAKVPFRTVVSLNLTHVPLVTRFEAEIKELPPAGLNMLRLPANEPDILRFRIDARSKSGMVPVANSSYQIGAGDRLLLLAVPNAQAAPGAPPLGLQMVLYHKTDSTTGTPPE
jgi:hypothetical protein